MLRSGISLIRQAEAKDLDAVLVIERQAFISGIRAETVDPFLDQLTHFPEGFLVAEYEGMVIGYVTAIPINSQDDLRDPDAKLRAPIGGGKMIYITSIACIHQTSCARGYWLGKAIIEKFHKLPAIGVLNPKWTRAMAMWGRLGFEFEDVIDDFFHPTGEPPEHGLIIYRQPHGRSS